MMQPSNSFQQAEEQFFLLRGQLEAGRITRAQFDAALKELMLQDAQGRYWIIGADSGRWHVHDGKAWVEAQPPALVSGRPTSLPERGEFIPSRPPVAFPPPERIAPRGRVSPMWVLAAGAAVLALVVCAGAGLFIASGLPTTVSQVPPASLAPTPPPPPLATPPVAAVQATATPPPSPVSVTILATSEPPKLLAPQEFAASSQNLANAIAELNRAELKFIRDARSATSLNPRLPGLALPLFFAPDPLDDDLREIAARAMIVAQTADTLGRTMVAQDGGSDAAGQAADQYYSIARLGYALVIETQNLREGLQARTLTRADAINTIAGYGARLWNPGVTDASVKGNPFLPHVKDATTIAPVQFLNTSAVAQLKTQVGATVQTWLATSRDVVTKTVNLPAPRAPVSNPFDPSLLQTLSTASGQADADRARQVAAKHLTMLTAPTSAPAARGAPTQLQFAAFKGASIADANQVAAGNVPSFANGSASALAKRARIADRGEELVDDLFELGPQEEPPNLTAQVPVKETKRPVILTITNPKVKRQTELQGSKAEVLIEFTLQWEAVVQPRFTIECLDKFIDAYWQKGSVTTEVIARMMEYPGDVDVTCTEKAAGKYRGFVTTSLFVGSPDVATARAYATETIWAAEAVATQNAQGTQAAATPASQATLRAVGTEVAASKTAEFRATVTAVARQTAQASQANIFTMNGTFSLRKTLYKPDIADCNPVVYTSGILTVTVDLEIGKVSGYLKGGGGGTLTGMTCGELRYDSTWSTTYKGELDGSVNPTSGELSLSSTSMAVWLTSDPKNCRMSDGSEWPCKGTTTWWPENLTITGTVDKTKRTGKGTVTVRNCMVKDHCVGDWHAGE